MLFISFLTSSPSKNKSWGRNLLGSGLGRTEAGLGRGYVACGTCLGWVLAWAGPFRGVQSAGGKPGF